MNSKQLVKQLEQDGWVLARVRGSRHQFRHPTKSGLVTVKHPDDDIPAGSLNCILKQAGGIKNRRTVMRFPVVLHTDDGIRFGVTVPDLPGCFSTGDTFDEALDSVVEAIELHLEGLTEEGNEIPVPHPIADHRKNPDFHDGVWAAVEVDVTRLKGKVGKVSITPHQGLISKTDAYAASQNVITFTTAKAVGETIILTIDADEADRADVWIDLNNSGRKDEGEAVTHFGNEYTTRTECTLGAQTISIYGKVTELYCDDSRLIALDVSKNPELTGLICYENQLTTLDLSNNPELTGLICYDNQLTALDVSNNPELTELNCYANQLTTLDLSENSELIELNCSGNQLTTLDLSNNLELIKLDCSGNQLTALNLSKNSGLTELTCYENKIDDEKMTALVGSLPDRTGKEVGYIKVPRRFSWETVIDINDTQRALAEEKNWEIDIDEDY